MSYQNQQQQLNNLRGDEDKYARQDNELRGSLQRQQYQQQDQFQDGIQKLKAIENLRNQYREQDRIRNGQINPADQRKNEILQKLVEDYRQLKDQSLSIQKDYDLKIKELLEKMQQQDQLIRNMQKENKTLHSYYQRAESLLAQQKDRIQELEELLRQSQQEVAKERQLALQNTNNSPFKFHQESETRNYVNTLSDDELIELIKLKRKVDFDKLLQSKEKSDIHIQQDNQQALPQINQSQTHPISFIRQVGARHQRSSSTFRQGIDKQSEQISQQQQVIKNQQKMIDKLINSTIQNQSQIQKDLNQQQPLQQQKYPQIEFIKDVSQIRQNSTSRLRNRSPIRNSQDQHIDFLQRSIESKDKIILDIHNSKTKKDKDEALIDFFNKQSSYLVDSNYDKKTERNKNN